VHFYYGRLTSACLRVTVQHHIKQNRREFILKRDLARLDKETFDLIIVGGGIVGAGVARDASLRGLHTLLVEKEDFAYGTTSR
jgi:heterodisulfide reductase subunit A-like polyferredoxin